MHLRRIATFVLGAWLAGSLLVLAVCFSNFTSIDDVRETKDSEVQHVLGASGDKLLKFMVTMENTRLLSGWELTQAPLGLLALALLAFQKPSRLLLIFPLVMLLLVGFEHLLLTPEIGWLSQAMALGRDTTALDQRGRLDNILRIYGVAEAVKFLVGMGLSISLFMMHTSTRRRRRSHADADELMESARLRP